jgi:hypothetical protein
MFFFKDVIITNITSVSASFWSFDNNTLDGLSSYNEVLVNSATYQSPGINGYGSALWLQRNLSEYVNIPSYLNLSYTSFTVEMWFYLTNPTNNDYGLFCQYYNTSTDELLHFLIRNSYLYMGFYADDLEGSTIIRNNIWYHAAFVYDYSSSRQSIYLNGILDGSRTSTGCFQGSAGSTLIGRVDTGYGTVDYFDG